MDIKMIKNSVKMDKIGHNLVTQFQSMKFDFTLFSRKVKKIRKII